MAELRDLCTVLGEDELVALEAVLPVTPRSPIQNFAFGCFKKCHDRTKRGEKRGRVTFAWQ